MTTEYAGRGALRLVPNPEPRLQELIRSLDGRPGPAPQRSTAALDSMTWAVLETWLTLGNHPFLRSPEQRVRSHRKQPRAKGLLVDRRLCIRALALGAVLLALLAAGAIAVDWATLVQSRPG